METTIQDGLIQGEYDARTLLLDCESNFKALKTSVESYTRSRQATERAWRTMIEDWTRTYLQVQETTCHNASDLSDNEIIHGDEKIREWTHIPPVHLEEYIDVFWTNSMMPLKEQFWEQPSNGVVGMERSLLREGKELYTAAKKTLQNMMMEIQSHAERSDDETTTSTNEKEVKKAPVESINITSSTVSMHEENVEGMKEEDPQESWIWGKLPERSTVPYLRPYLTPILSGQEVKTLAAGGQHLLYLTVSGDVYQYNWTDVGAGSEPMASSPTAVRHNVALPRPQVVQGFALDKALHGRRVLKIACGSQHSVAVTNDGELFTWGSGEDGRLGHGDRRDRNAPRKVTALLNDQVLYADCGGAHTVVCTSNGQLFAFGRGRNGRLGVGHERNCDSPTAVLNVPSLDRVACGWNFSLAWNSKVAGTLFAWGKQREGQCGIGYAQTDQVVPVLVHHLQNEVLVDVACGYTHSVALSTTGKVFSWGLGEYGQLGTGSVYQAKPEEIKGLQAGMVLPPDKVSRVACGSFHSAVITERAVVLAWGLNIYGQCGLGHTTNRDIPERVMCVKPPRALSIVLGDHFSILFEEKNKNVEQYPFTQVDNVVLNSPRQKRKNLPAKEEEKRRRICKIWRNKILPDWETSRDTHFSHTSWRLGIPPTLRYKVWPLAIGNVLKITPEMYTIYSKRASTMQQEILNSSEPHDLSSSNMIGREATISLLHTDVPRTFPSLGLFDESGPYYAQVLDLLTIYACYRPDLGYIQGMSYVAAMLVLHIPHDPYLAFQCLANLMVTEHLFTFYLLDVELAASYYTLFDSLLHTTRPCLHSHLHAVGITPQLYLRNWFQLVFLQTLPLEIASRVWDCFLLDGTVYLFRTALAILELLEPYLLGREVDEALPLIQKSIFYQDLWHTVITESELFATIDRISIPSSLYNDLDRVIHDVFFYAKDEYASGRGKSAGVARVKEESKSMYKLSDTLNGVLGGF